MGAHIDAQADKSDAFGLQAHALFEAMFPGEENLSARADDTLPGNARSAAMERPRHLAGVARVSGSISDIAIGGDFAAWDTADLGEEEFEEIVFAWRCHG